MALGAFARSVEFILMKGKAAFSTLCRGNVQSIFGMLEAFQKVFDILFKLTRRYSHVASNIGDSQRVI
jgi:hypothetical protein